MLSYLPIAWLGACTLQQVVARDAALASSSSGSVVYVATLSEASGGGDIKGSISAEAGSDGMGVKFTVDFSDLPLSGGPFGELSCA